MDFDIAPIKEYIRTEGFSVMDFNDYVMYDKELIFPANKENKIVQPSESVNNGSEDAELEKQSPEPIKFLDALRNSEILNKYYRNFIIFSCIQKAQKNNLS